MMGDHSARELMRTETDSQQQPRTADGIFVESVLSDLRFAGRLLRKSPAFTLTVLLTMGLALGATTVIYSFLHFIVLRPLPFHSPDAIVRIGSCDNDAPDRYGKISLTDFADWK